MHVPEHRGPITGGLHLTPSSASTDLRWKIVRLAPNALCDTLSKLQLLLYTEISFFVCNRIGLRAEYMKPNKDQSQMVGNTSKMSYMPLCQSPSLHSPELLVSHMFDHSVRSLPC